MHTPPFPSLVPYALGDATILAVFTVAGFATHHELTGAGGRIIITFLALCLAWALVAPWLGLYRAAIVRDGRQLWRVLLSALIASPLAGWLRGIALNEPIPPIFILVMAAMTGAMMLVWRGVWLFVAVRRAQHG
ncbi:MAG: DUF3054 domain-containing protein [Anaerolineaceae bacterium]|nr:DUF3054 domain-containing protein [Anaerolineaceae bacterium]